MRLVNRPIKLMMAGLAMFLGLAIAGYPLAVMAEFVPPKRGLPGRREGGGTRDPRACVKGDPGQLVALLPDTNLGLTTAAYPRFFWFVPQTRAKLAEFSLHTVATVQNADRTTTYKDTGIVYQATFSITGKPGIASLTLPSDASIPPLNIGQDYRWRLALVCDTNNRNNDVKVEGWVSRVVPDGPIARQLQQATPQDRVDLYASNGYWFDTLTTLAELRCERPQDAALAKTWADLLKTVRLSAIADQPLVQQCPVARSSN